MNTKISFYNSYQDIYNSTTIDVIKDLPSIITQYSPRISSALDQIRSEPSEEIQRQLKGALLPLFTVSGTFSQRRKDNLTDYSSFICLDFDHIESLERFSELWELFKTVPSVFLMFRSPRNGIKVIVAHTNTNYLMHKELFIALYDTPEFHQEEFDKGCSDYTRGTYLSWDPDAYVNYNFIPYQFHHIDEPVNVPPTVQNNLTQVYNSDLSQLINDFNDGYTDMQIINYMLNHFWKKQSNVDFAIGNRHNSLLKKASKLCAYGVSYDSCIKEMLYRYTYKGLLEEEVRQTVDYCYHTVDFGSQRQEFLDMKNFRQSDSDKLNSIFNNVLQNENI